MTASYRCWKWATLAGWIAGEVDQMPKKLEVREGDTLTIKVRVSRVSDDGDKITVSVVGQPFPAPVEW